MINRDIIEGLRNALSRGYTLEQAMMSFYNAGYKKEEIEESAGELHAHPSQPLSHPQKQVPEEIQQPVTKPIPPEFHPTPQIVSKYEEQTKPKGKLMIILLLFILFVLILLFVGVFIFKKELVDFFNTLFQNV